MRNGRRRSWIPGVLLVALMALAGPTGGTSSSVGAVRGGNPADFAMLACGYCVGAGIFLTITGTWMEILAAPIAWGKAAGCVTACYETFS